MILRLLNFVVIGALILAAAYVYRIKFDSTVQAERLAKIRGEVRHERDAIAALRAEWGVLDNPARIQALAQRFLKLKTVAPTQFDTFDHLPDRPPPPDMTAADDDPIGGVIENFDKPDTITGSVPDVLAPPPAPSGAAPGSSPAAPPGPPAVPIAGATGAADPDGATDAIGVSGQ